MTSLDTKTLVDRGPIRIAIVEDHALLAHALSRSLGDLGFVADSVVPSEDTALVAAVAELRPDIVLLDLDLGRFGSSVRLIPALCSLGSRVVVVTGETSRARWGECIEAGAEAVVTKAVSFDELLERVCRILDVHNEMVRAEQEDLRRCAREHRWDKKVRHERFERLTARERDILAALMEGLSADEIASRAFVSMTTVRSHIRSILQKLEVNSQVAAVAAAFRSEWGQTAGESRSRRTHVPRNPQD